MSQEPTPVRSLAAAAVAAVIFLIPAPTMAAGPPSAPVEVSVMKEGDGYVFRNDLGQALYAYAADRVGKSNCVARCAEIWPPFLAPPDARPVADWTLIDRGGAKQWAYKGRPVYTHAGDDAAPVSGGSPDGVWREIRP